MTTRQIFAVTAMFSVSAIYADDYVYRADANGDGFVSLHELRAAHYADPEFNKRIEQSFDHYDRNRDGLISEEERRAVPSETEEAETYAQIEKRHGEIDAGSSGGASPGESKATSEGEVSFTAADSRTAGSHGNSEPAAGALLVLKRDADLQDDPLRQVGSSNKADGKEQQRAPRNDGSNSRTESWVREIDADRSGGASIAELVASGDGEQWFSDDEFHAADRNGDGDLDAAELAALIRSLERRQR